MNREIPEKFRLIKKVRENISQEEAKLLFLGEGDHLPYEERTYDYRISYPYPEPILQYFKDIYDKVFVALHPFLRIDGFDPSTTAKGKLILDRSSIEGKLTIEVLDELRKKEDERADMQYSTFEKYSKMVGERVSWSSVGMCCQLQEPKNMCRALYAAIDGFSLDIESMVGAERLTDYCNSEKLFMPESGGIPASWENVILELFERLGFESFLAGDEFDDQVEELSVDSIDRNSLWKEDAWTHTELVRKLYTADFSMTCLVDWESYSTLICCDSQRIDISQIEDLFDGFWCDDRTELYWSKQ